MGIYTFAYNGICVGAVAFDNPVNSDWAVNALAPAIADPVNPALVVRAFDYTIEEGVGFACCIPDGATSIAIRTPSRSSSTPETAHTIGRKLYYRRVCEDNTPISNWSSLVLDDFNIPATASFQSMQEQSIVFDTFSPALIAGGRYQFELTRIAPVGGVNLASDWYLLCLEMYFAH